MNPIRLILTALPDVPLIAPGDDLVATTLDGLQQVGIDLIDGDVLIYAQKVVSKSEDRYQTLNTVQPSPEAEELARETGKDPRLVEIILNESASVIRKKDNLIIVEHRLGFVCANAGVDHSNVENSRTDDQAQVLLLPEDPDASAKDLRDRIEEQTGSQIGVLIIDSHGRAWRLGTVGVAIGVSGFPALEDRRGKPDVFGEPLQSTQVGLADEIAAAASALMGQADERRPIIHARGIPYALREGTLNELLRPIEEDLFR